MRLRIGPLRALFSAALALLASVAVADAPADYALRLPVTPGTGGALQRLDLTAQVLAASREAGLADVRIFDARGRPVPLALSPLSAPRMQRTVRLVAMPIRGEAEALARTGISLTIDAGAANVVRVDGATTKAGTDRVLGALFDTRGLSDPAERLQLTADIPGGRPIVFAIAASADLRNWEHLADTTFYDARGGVVASPVDLPDVPLTGRYLRVTWTPSSASVSIKGASVTITRSADRSGWPRAVIRPTTQDARTITFSLPFATPIAALEVIPNGRDTVVPIRILGRSDREQPWSPVAAGSVFSLGSGAANRRNPPFDLHGTPLRNWRIEANPRSNGFAQPPTIAVRFTPARLLFLADGQAPYTLAVGHADAPSVYLPAADLIPGYGPATEGSLPRASLAAAPEPVIAATEENGDSRQSALLWGILLLATVLLGAMVWRLTRERRVV